MALQVEVKSRITQSGVGALYSCQKIITHKYNKNIATGNREFNQMLFRNTVDLSPYLVYYTSHALI